MADGIQAVAKSLKRSFKGSPWWKFTQPDVRRYIEWLLDNIEDMGCLFRDAFVALFRYEHMGRLKAGIAKSSSEPSPMFKKMPEECYQAGIHPTKTLLRLDDWVQPNDADVHAVMVLCQQIDTLESIDLLHSPKKPELEKIVASLADGPQIRLDNASEKQ